MSDVGAFLWTTIVLGVMAAVVGGGATVVAAVVEEGVGVGGGARFCEAKYAPAPMIAMTRTIITTA
jgi:hypothetical protein